MDVQKRAVADEKCRLSWDFFVTLKKVTIFFPDRHCRRLIALYAIDLVTNQIHNQLILLDVITNKHINLHRV